MDTTNKHIGNVLADMTNKDRQEVFEQFAKKTIGLGYTWRDDILTLIEEIINCDDFDNEGDMTWKNNGCCADLMKICKHYCEKCPCRDCDKRFDCDGGNPMFGCGE